MTYTTLQAKHRIDTFRRALTIGLGAQLLAAPALLGQDAAQPASSSEPLELERVVITGSLIPTAETVTVTPVSVFSSTDIQDVGARDTLNALRFLSPDFNGSLGQESGNGGSGGEAWIQLRNLPTLLLLDGTRLANSAFSNGSSVDANSIPTSMIERIEVLKDGGSVLYGSQAVGGVVNIITKKNYTGVDMGGRWGFGTQDGNYNENLAYVVFGSTTDKAKFTGGIQHYHADQILAKDRDYASLDIDELIAQGIAPAQNYLSPSFAGRVQSGGENFILAGSPLLRGTPFYNPAMIKPPVQVGTSYDTVQAYNAANPGVYVNLNVLPNARLLDQYSYQGTPYSAWTAYGVFNTTELGSAMNNSQDRNQAFANASYELFGKEMEIYGQFLYANTTSDFQLAPSPVSALGGARIFIPATDPNNPFQRDLGYLSNANPRVRTRFVESGNRVFQNQNDLYHFVGGLKGKFDNDWAYNAYYDYNRNDQIQYTRNGINGSALDSAVTPNPDPALAALGLSALQDEKGVAVPLYNVFSVAGNDPRTLETMRTTLFNSGVSELWDAQGVITGAPLDLPGGKLGVALGGGFLQESLQLDVDGLSKIGKVPGLNPVGPTPGGSRNNGYGFVEVQAPVTAPDMDLPALYSVQLTAAGRYETFNPGGDKAVPKVGIRWQPVDESVTLRATYSQSFVSPTVWQLYGGPAVSAETVPGGQVTTTWVSNQFLTPSDAENWSGGVVWSPKWVKGLTLTCDFYSVSTENDVYRRSATEVFNSLNALGVNSPYARDFTFVDGSKITTAAPNQVNVDNWGSADLPLLNGAQIETKGFDVSATYVLPLENYGTLTFSAAANVIMDYTYQDPVIGGPYEYNGQFTDNGVAGGAVGTLPDFTLVASVNWQYKGFSVTLNTRYVPGVDDLGTLHPSSADTENFYTLDHGVWKVDPFYTLNAQVGYTFSSKGGNDWYDGTRLAVGCNNITDRDPSIVVSSSNNNTDASAYDIIGRFIYFEVGKKF
ncbi:MAG: TonB-dependent receptor plug domain-containing protein [Verrucomicrobia bacterium]|nr:TonB-dependent receptor plug domain-containing protein [Verrucomicrobiota bacterium]